MKGGIKHLPFFDVCGHEEKNSPRARIATAGLLVLRHIDFWVLAGMVMVEPECKNVHSSREMIAALSPDDPARVVLFSIINAMQTSKDVDVMPLLPKLIAYAEILDREEWSKPLAADVHYTVSRLAGLQREAEEDAAEFLARLLELIDPPEEPPSEATPPG